MSAVGLAAGWQDWAAFLRSFRNHRGGQVEEQDNSLDQFDGRKSVALCCIDCLKHIQYSPRWQKNFCDFFGLDIPQSPQPYILFSRGDTISISGQPCPSESSATVKRCEEQANRCTTSLRMPDTQPNTEKLKQWCIPFRSSDLSAKCPILFLFHQSPHRACLCVSVVFICFLIWLSVCAVRRGYYALDAECLSPTRDGLDPRGSAWDTNRKTDGPFVSLMECSPLIISLLFLTRYNFVIT